MNKDRDTLLADIYDDIFDYISYNLRKDLKLVEDAQDIINYYIEMCIDETFKRTVRGLEK